MSSYAYDGSLTAYAVKTQYVDPFDHTTLQKFNAMMRHVVETRDRVTINAANRLATAATTTPPPLKEPPMTTEQLTARLAIQQAVVDDLAKPAIERISALTEVERLTALRDKPVIAPEVEEKVAQVLKTAERVAMTNTEYATSSVIAAVFAVLAKQAGL